MRNKSHFTRNIALYLVVGIVLAGILGAARIYAQSTISLEVEGNSTVDNTSTIKGDELIFGNLTVNGALLAVQASQCG